MLDSLRYTIDNRAHERRRRHRLQITFGVAHVEGELLPLLESHLPETVPQPVDGCEVRASLKDDSYAIDAGRLRLGGERRGEEAEGNAGDEGASLHYSIT